MLCFSMNVNYYPIGKKSRSDSHDVNFKRFLRFLRITVNSARNQLSLKVSSHLPKNPIDTGLKTDFFSGFHR